MATAEDPQTPRSDRIEAELEILRSDAELAGLFLVEALDHLSSIEAVVLQLEATPADTGLLNDLFRPFHTIKGNAGALGVTSVQELAHQVENLLDRCRAGKHPFGAPEADMVLKAVDVLTAIMKDIERRLAGGAGQDLEAARVDVLIIVTALLEDGPTEAVPSTRDASPAAVTLEPVEESVGDVTGAAPAATPVIAPPVTVPAATSGPAPSIGSPDRPEPSNRPTQPPAPVPSAGVPSPAVAVAPRRADEGQQATVKVETRKLDNLIDMVGELVIAQSIIQEHPALAGQLHGSLARQLGQLKRITSDLQRNAMSMRMVPIRQTFQKMARLVRDLSKKSGKSVDLVLHGEETELDRRMVEELNDPLMHMVRNSVDHGIEPSDARRAAGKSGTGQLTLSAYHQGGSVVIAIADDGGGLKADRILAKARAQGLVGEHQTLTTGEIHQLIFKPGFSTAEQITEISGRGVGMDVVRRNIEALRGRVDIQSEVGQGTTFFIKLPLTLAILDGLIVTVGAERYVLPVFSVRESFRPTPDQIHTVQGTACMLRVRDRVIRLIHLSSALGFEAPQRDISESTVILLDNDGDSVGLVVDDLVGRQEVVIKSLGDALGHVRGLAGSAILGDGRVGLILDTQSLADPRWQPATRVA